MVLEGWIGLFDGKTTFGWTASNPQLWEANSSTGELKTKGSGKAKAELLRTTAQFDDFELELEFKAEKQTNSGVFIRTQPEAEKRRSRLLRNQHRNRCRKRLSPLGRS